MQNFAYFQRQPFNAYSCHCKRDASCHMTCLSLSVCPFAQLENHGAELHQIFAHVACGRSSVVAWWRCDMLSTSGFVDDVVFSNNGPMARRV